MVARNMMVTRRRSSAMYPDTPHPGHRQHRAGRCAASTAPETDQTFSWVVHITTVADLHHCDDKLVIVNLADNPVHAHQIR